MWVRVEVQVGERSKAGTHCFHKAVLLLLKGSIPGPTVLKNVAI